MAAVETSEARVRPQARVAGRVGGSLPVRLRAFRDWWTQALASWLPERIRELLGMSPMRLSLRRAGQDLELALLRGDEPRQVAVLSLADVQVPVADPLDGILARRIADVPRWLLLPEGTALRRRMTLPLAAADRLNEVLAFEIDRQTPFAANEVRHDARVVARRGDGQVDVELVVVPNALLDRELATLGPLAATLSGVDVVDADGTPLGVNLLASAARDRREDPWRTWNLVFVAVAMLALVAGLWQVLANRRAAADMFAQQVEQEVQRARGAAAEQRRLLDLVEGTQFLQQVRAGRPTTVEIVDELARRLPDTTFLDKLSIEGDRILLIGYSSDSSALVKQLEGSSLWRNAALTGALQPDPRTRKDRFTLVAELVVRDAGEPGGGDAR
ncbi:MAG: PilN domain-containing protein [Luteimonas sp.]|nr:PilN domain-containing protein [Luteimonas sp.]